MADQKYSLTVANWVQRVAFGSPTQYLSLWTGVDAPNPPPFADEIDGEVPGDG